MCKIGARPRQKNINFIKVL